MRKARAWLAMAVLGLVGVLILAVLPARALVAQHAERRQVAARIHELDERNRDLEGRGTSLQTDTEIERLARQQYNLVRPNEEVFDIITHDPRPPAAQAAKPEDSDPGWPRALLSRLTAVF